LTWESQKNKLITKSDTDTYQRICVQFAALLLNVSSDTSCQYSIRSPSEATKTMNYTNVVITRLCSKTANLFQYQNFNQPLVTERRLLNLAMEIGRPAIVRTMLTVSPARKDCHTAHACSSRIRIQIDGLIQIWTSARSLRKCYGFISQSFIKIRR